MISLASNVDIFFIDVCSSYSSANLVVNQNIFHLRLPQKGSLENQK